MLKYIIYILIIGLIGFGLYWLVSNSNAKNDLVVAQAELFCFLENNRLTPGYMNEDGLSQSQINLKIEEINQQSLVIAQKFGFGTWTELSISATEKFMDKLGKLNQLISSKTEELCNLVYNP